MKLDVIRKNAKAGTLEVEHLLCAAKLGIPGLAVELRRLSAELHWPSEGSLPDGSRVVPFGRWAEIVALYASDGYDGLASAAADPTNTKCILGLLEELKTPEALAFLLEDYALLIDGPKSDLPKALQIAGTLNNILSFKPLVPITSSQAQSIQDFLLALYTFVEREADRATVVLALRGVGDEAALEFVSALPEFAEPWSTVKATTIRSLRKRIRANAL
jgi:hypothetical protein